MNKDPAELWHPTTSVPVWPGVVIGLGASAILIGAMLYGVNTATGPDSEREKKWDGAVIVRICRDGTHIYRLKDGLLHTGGFGGVVESLEVCQ